MRLIGFKICVTGGMGYVGSHTAMALAEEGAEVYVIDNRHVAQNIVKGVTAYYPGEYNNVNLLKLLEVNGIDGIVHCAGTSLVGPSIKDPSLYYKNNVSKTILMLDNLVTWKKIPFVVFSSSAAVYGSPTRIDAETMEPIASQYPLHENAMKHPINPYGRTKAMIEDILADYSKAYGIDSFSLRYFNACGAHGGLGPEPDATHIIPKMFETYNANDQFKIYGNDYNTPDGTNIRDYIHVQDLAEAHIISCSALANGHNSGDTTGASVYNLGSDDGYSNLELITEFDKAVDGKLDYEIVDRRPGDPDVLIADGHQFRYNFDWEPKHSDMANIMATTRDFYKGKTCVVS